MQLIRVHIHGVKVYEQLGMGPYYMPHKKMGMDNLTYEHSPVFHPYWLKIGDPSTA